MRLPFSWLCEYLETHETIEALCETLTSIGLEVEDIKDLREKLAPFRVVYIKNVSPHPHAERLQICHVDTGSEQLDIVCGASNARAGMCAVLAPIGATMPGNGMKIKASTIRGIESGGMLCSEEELGLASTSDGIIELPSDSKLGVSYVALKGLDDPVITLKVTPNRGDCLGIYGIARDLAAAGKGQLKTLAAPSLPVGGKASPIQFTIENTEACPYYLGCYIENVDANAPSPEWITRRLEAIGEHSISALVDITNYFTHAFGRPMHVFDADKIGSHFTITSAIEDEIFHALDGKNYALKDNMCVAVSDSREVLALGGVIGSEDSSCKKTTKNIWLEVAWFDPISVSSTGRQLNIHTNASYRFERHVDPEFVIQGAALAIKMIQEISGGMVHDPVISGRSPYKSQSIFFPCKSIKEQGGVDIEIGEIKNRLEKIGCLLQEKTKETGISYEVTPPSYRPDIKGKEDLVEEIIRLHGLDKIPLEDLPKIDRPFYEALPVFRKRLLCVRRSIAQRGYHEIVTWSFMAKDKVKKWGETLQEGLHVQNPIHSSLNSMRPSLLPNMLDKIVANNARDIKNCAFFEVGPIFMEAESGKQQMTLAMVRIGYKVPRNPYGSARLSDVIDMKADMWEALEAMHCPMSKIRIEKEAPSHYHPGCSGTVYLGKKALAYFGMLHPSLGAEWGIEGEVFMSEVYLEALPPSGPQKGATKLRWVSHDLHPIHRDFAFVVEKTLPAQRVLQSIREVEKNLITEVILFDIYEGMGIEEQMKSLAVSVTFQPQFHTLQDVEIIALCEKIERAVKEKCAGTLRQG